MENNKRTIEIKLKLNEVESQMIQELEEIKGYSKSESLRFGMRLLHKQEFQVTPRAGRPKKDIVKLEPEIKIDTGYVMSPENYCTNVLKGQVVERDGIQCCEYQLGACTVTDPLETLQK